MSNIAACLWFDDNAEEAVNFYMTVFKNAKIHKNVLYPPAAEGVSGRPAGSVMSISFELDGQQFLALNGGPVFKFTEAVSFMFQCDTQEEIDYYFDKLSAVKESEQCGWVKDKFGLSWQIVPRNMDALMGGDPAKANKAMAAMLRMKKLDIHALEQAREAA